ncbi:MAG: SDR family oxidoreductase [Planctomycetota bacterium]
MSARPFAGEVAVVTGAGGLLCSAIAQDLAQRGAAVALLGRTAASLEAVAERIHANGGCAVVATADVTDSDSIQVAAATVREALGPCSLLINGAGGNQAEAITTLTQFDPAELELEPTADTRGFFNLDLDRFGDVLRSNTLGTVIPCREFGRDLVAAKRGVVLNFASMNSYRPITRVPAYAMAKAAIVNFTQWLAVYLAPANVRVNAIAPGFFVNDRSRKILMTPDGNLSSRGQNVMHHTPLGRFGQVEELLGTARWLLDDSASGYVTGQTIPVDGGFLASAGV